MALTNTAGNNWRISNQLVLRSEDRIKLCFHESDSTLYRAEVQSRFEAPVVVADLL